MIDFSEVLITDSGSPRVHATLHDKRPQARTFLWNGTGNDAQFYRTLSRAGIHLIAQTSLRDEVEATASIRATAARDVDDKIDSVIAEHASKKESAGTGPVLFCPCNDTHSHMFAPVARRIPGAEFLVADVRPGENAEATLRALGIQPIVGDVNTIREIRPSVIALGNDWNLTMKKIVTTARALRIPTVCLQEGCLDFDSDSRMAIADFPMIQGPIMPSYLQRTSYLPTGNPRFDLLKPLPLPEKQCVMINCNFTYSVHEDQRDQWVRDVTGSCKALGLDYFISQHPRDKGVFPNDPVRPSHAGVVHEHLADATILVTRFSTLIYEAMLLGRRAIYYNPFGEKMRLFNEDRTHGLLKAFNAQQLSPTLEKASAPMDNAERERFDLFLALHCGASDGGASARVAKGLEWIAREANPLPKQSLFSFLGF